MRKKRKPSDNDVKLVVTPIAPQPQALIAHPPRDLTPHQVYLSAIRNDGSINVGYLFLFKVMNTFWIELGAMTVGAAACMFVAWGDAESMIKVLSAYGVAVGIVAGANFLTALTGIAAFLWGDAHSAPATPSTTTKVEQTQVTTP